MKNIYFTPGPAELYFTVDAHLKQAIKSQIPSVSHRSQTFQSVYQECVENLKALMNIPDDFQIFFTASATEIWERIIQNNVEHHSHHYVNGAFSERFLATSQELNRKTSEERAEVGQRVIPDASRIPAEAELIAFTLNETSTGAIQPLTEIYNIAESHPDKLIAVDAVSIMPYPKIIYNKVDSVFFSVQKGFGLPAGLGVWILSPRSVEKAQQLKDKGISIGTYHSIPSLLEKAKKNQTPETPNVLNIYLLAKVCGDMLEKGIEKIRQEAQYKSTLMYHTLEEHPFMSPFVKEPEIRSPSVIVAETDKASDEIIGLLSKHQLLIGSGYGKYKKNHIRIANFPTHSKEQFELLADKLNELK